MANPTPTSGTLTAWSHEKTGAMRRIVIGYTSSSTAGTFTLPVNQDGGLFGLLLGVCFVPGATPPTNLYDFVLNDDDVATPQNDIDYFNAKGANLLAAPTNGYEWKAIELSSGQPVPIATPSWTLKGTNMGNSKTGVIQIFYR